MAASTPTSHDQRMRVLRLLGAGAASILTAMSMLWADHFPWLVPLATGLSWAVGKLLGVPVDDVIADALRGMRPEKVADLAVGAIGSMPPETASTAVQRIAASIRPAANARAGAAITLTNVDASDSGTDVSER